MAEDGKQCIRQSLQISTSNIMAWEIFRSALDQWDANGGYNFFLAVEIIKGFGFKGPDFVDQISRIRNFASELKVILDMTAEEEKERQEFFDQQRKNGVLK